jgi:DNA-3-methyladenine glycosylase I
VPAGKPDKIAYHDTEWGVPAHDDWLLFEMLTWKAHRRA